MFFRIKKETKPHYVIGTEAFLTLCLYILTTRKRKQISIEPRRMNQCNVIFNHSYISCNFVYLFMMINITISIRINTHLSEYKGAYLYILLYVRVQHDGNGLVSIFYGEKTQNVVDVVGKVNGSNLCHFLFCFQFIIEYHPHVLVSCKTLCKKWSYMSTMQPRHIHNI